MSRDVVIESWLASMSKSELVDQCFVWQDTALEHGRKYNAVKAENAKLRDEVERLRSVVSDGADNAREILAENDKLRKLTQQLLTEYRYMRVRPRKMYLGHEKRMRSIEDEMRELGIEVEE